MSLKSKQLWFLASPFGRLLPDPLYLRWRYKLAFGRQPDLAEPRTYNEKLQWLKLHDRQPLYHTLVDKVAVKQYVAERIGAQYVVPTLGVWESSDRIDWESLPDRFVLKCSHDSGSALICRDKSVFDISKAKRLDDFLAVDFYALAREWPYKGVPRRILAEEYLGDNIPDYKFFCFDGEPRLMFVASDRNVAGSETRFDFYDMDFRHLDVRNGHPNSPEPMAKPACWEEMKDLARRLSAGMPHVRVDFYEVDGKVYFGEYTFYHWGGMVPFDPPCWDVTIGDMLKCTKL